jgi:hypothetical protein
VSDEDEVTDRVLRPAKSLTACSLTECSKGRIFERRSNTFALAAEREKSLNPTVDVVELRGDEAEGETEDVAASKVQTGPSDLSVHQILPEAKLPEVLQVVDVTIRAKVQDRDHRDVAEFEITLVKGVPP